MDAHAQRVEALGPAERAIQAVTHWVDHMVHNRPGLVTHNGTVVGASWQQATWKLEGDQKVVYTVRKVGKKQYKTKVGVGVPGTDEVRENGQLIGQFRNPGLFPEVVKYLYEQVALVWRLDNEFCARWASWAYHNETKKDLKVVLAAFMLVQDRFGELVKDGDESFFDEDFREVGEAMCLTRSRKKGHTFDPKLLLRVGDVLSMPAVAEINRKMGFGRSARKAAMGRYLKVLEKWLQHMEANPQILEMLVKEKGFRTKIMQIARRVGYKPETDKFFETLRWRQKQAKDGRRSMGIDELGINRYIFQPDMWTHLSEGQICEKIMKEKPNWKIIAGKLPKEVGVTPAIMCAAIEAGSLSDQDLIIMTPTLEELGLLTNVTVERKWRAAIEKAENQRAENIKRNVRTEKAKKGLEDAVDKAAEKAVAEVAKGLRIYVVVDKSGSMEGAIERAKGHLSKFVGAFPLDKLHVSIFSTVGTEVVIKAPTRAAVTQAFRGHNAGGGTSYANGVGCLLAKYKPNEDEDAVIFFVGDQDDEKLDQLVHVIQASGVNPVAFGMLHVVAPGWGGGNIVQAAAARLGIPCFMVDEKVFADAYAVPRTIRNLIANTPVGKLVTSTRHPMRVTLIDQILKTPLLRKPVWA